MQRIMVRDSLAPTLGCCLSIDPKKIHLCPFGNKEQIEGYSMHQELKFFHNLLKMLCQQNLHLFVLTVTHSRTDQIFQKSVFH